MSITPPFICILSLVICAYVFRKLGYSLSLTKLNFGSFVFYFQFLLSAGLGVILIGFGVSGHYMIDRVVTPELSDKVLWSLSYSFLGSAIAAYVVIKILYGDIQKRIQQSTNKPWKVEDSAEQAFIWFLIIVNYVAMMYVIRCIGSIPVIELISGNATMEKRIEISRSFPGNEIIKNLFGVTLSLVVCFSNALRAFSRPCKTHTLIFVVALIPAIFFATYSYEKSPLIFLSFGILIAWIMAKGSISRGVFAIFGVMMVVFVILLYLLLGIDREDLASSGITAGPIGRILFTQIAGMYMSFTYFPQVHDFVGFESIGGTFSSLFGIDNSSGRVARIIMEIFNPTGVSEGVAGVVNSYYIAEAWGNFGASGIVISPLVVGLWIALLNIIEHSMPKTSFNRAVIIFFALKLPIGGGFNDFIFSINSFYVLILLFFASLISDFKLVHPSFARTR